ncbi:hemerythrin domain-containing protein [Actinacidiphila sp. DG2A-62]|uniref:hemerythrin domain-containing protein n=1 Tax=Actinacidiphila sp. DG2A-62 TaxID=3108821 RepID=UPI002DBB16D4|nr:hemerythrin domain-containing protein [Actinacidiphila sp. DG2A-62]MEC3996903.1 hemerythrin domain-containing protein [Actinacidiphila sp. DG2A-62]
MHRGQASLRAVTVRGGVNTEPTSREIRHDQRQPGQRSPAAQRARRRHRLLDDVLLARRLHPRPAAADRRRDRRPAGEQPVRNGWATFKHQLHVHHVGEDVTLWPPLREKITSPAEIGVLDLMEAEHGRIDPLLASIDAVLGSGAGGGEQLVAEVRELADALGAHMEHEEDRALALVETHLGQAGWDHYTDYMRKTNGLKGGGAYLAWLLDDAPEATVKHVLGLLPPPVRVLYRRVFQPRYARTPRWTTG